MMTACIFVGDDVAYAKDIEITKIDSTVISSAAITAAASSEGTISKKQVATDPFAPSDEPVDLLADEVTYDENAGIVTASGNIELVQAGRIVRAEKIFYNLPQDKLIAEGNVVLNEVTGDTYFADRVELEDKMKNGFVNGLRGVLVDGSRFSAQQAEKIADLKIILSKASYTACEPCKKDPSKAPVWQIKARELIHHKDEQRISYDDATFEVGGLPVLYMPYFSHADGTVKRKSGFLTPTVGFDSDLGAFYQQEYYWNIAPNKDATIGAMVMTDETPLITGQYRHRFRDAQLLLSGGTTYAGRIDRVGGNDVAQDDEFRGHLFLDGLWNINDKWRAGTGLEIVTDEQYLRQYNISNEDVLENEVYVERFSGRDYGTARLIGFKDIRVSDRAEDQPNILPEIYTRFLGAPNSLLGGRGSLELSGLALQREGNDQDLARGTIEAGWQKRHVSHWGLVNTLDLSVRGDGYKVTDIDLSTNPNATDDDLSAVRGFANANLQTSLPFSKNFEKSQMVIEPMVSITAATNLDNEDDIPNEDSLDVFLDSTNLFNANRFPGYDRIEDKTHTTYGVRTGLYGDNGYNGQIFFGQSYRFDEDDNPFPDGSGLSEQVSDFVGNVSLQLGPRLDLNYDVQLENNNLASQRHELDASGKIGDLSLSTRYFYIDALQGTDFTESREQILGTARYGINDQWSVFTGAQYDLADNTEGLRRLSYGLDYTGQCVNFGITGRRILTRDSTGDSDTEIFARIGLKNLGEFETSGISLGSDGDDDDEEDDFDLLEGNE
jgi:LPS-assembly protein